MRVIMVSFLCNAAGPEMSARFEFYLHIIKKCEMNTKCKSARNFPDYVNRNRRFLVNPALPFSLAVLLFTALLPAKSFAGITVCETESLTVAGVTAGDVHRVFGLGAGADPSLSAGYGTILEGLAAGHYVTYTVNVPQTGACNVRIGVKTGTDRGIFQLAVNGTNRGSPQDLYTAANTYTELDIATFNVTSAGNNAITFTLTGKNAASSSYWLALDYVKLIFSGSAGSIMLSGSGIQVSVDSSTGAYSVVSTDPAWLLSGSLNQVLSGAGTTAGSDNVGAYQEAYFNYQSGSYEGRIRVYTNSKPVVIFKTRSLNGSNSNLGPYFPDFTVIPSGLNAHGYGNDVFAPFQFGTSGISPNSPGIYYDNSANCFILSPASHFMDAYAVWGTARVASGLQNWPNSSLGIANGYTHSVMLVVTQGINNAFGIWGQALTDYQNKVRPQNDADMGLKYVGLWTDQQGPYWYALNGFANYDVELTAVKAKYDSLKIKLGYVQLDSWWYIKDPANWLNRPGCYLYEPVPLLFPTGIANLNTRLGVPYITHNRWIGGSVAGDVTSPYRSQYTMSNGVSIDPAFWNKIIGDIASWGVKTYEQDWLNVNASASNTLGHGEKFMDEMARATNANGLTLQYCMGTPRHYLQASKYGHVTTLRSCGDKFSMPDDWGSHLYCSQLIKSVGSWPWVDNFQTSELGNTLLCVLTGGMVGVSDTFANINKPSQVANLLKMVRRDGLSIKSDLPLVPTDTTYVRRAAGARTYLCATSSTVSGKKIIYVWDWANQATNYSSNFRPADFGMSGNVYVYNYFDNAGSLIAANTAYTYPISGGTPGALGTDWKYYILSPAGPSGMALVGDQGKYVTFSKNRINAISETSSSMTVSVAFGAYDANTPDQAAVMLGYSPVAVTVTPNAGGAVSNQTYNTTTHVFRFDFQPSGTYSGEVLRSVNIGNTTGVVNGSGPAVRNKLPNINLRNGSFIIENFQKAPFTVTLIGLNGKIMKKWKFLDMPSGAVTLPHCAFGVYEIVIEQEKNVLRKKIVIAK